MTKPISFRERKFIKMKLALQIYTLREYLGTDNIKDTLRRTKEMGYDGIEWFGLMGYTPAELAELTRSAGLEFFSVHINMQDVNECNTEVMDALAAEGVKWLPIGWLPEECLAGGAEFEKTCALIRKYSKEAAARGMHVLYHNHDFDLVRLNDTTKLDALYAEMPGDVLGAELDTCWLYSGGVDAAEYIVRYSDRSPVIHLKDCVKEGGRKSFKPVGSGVLNWDEILPVCGNAQWICVEMDEPSDGLDAFRCAEMSAGFLKSKLG